jgi:hypothetical protein
MISFISTGKHVFTVDMIMFSIPRTNFCSKVLYFHISAATLLQLMKNVSNIPWQQQLNVATLYGQS